MTSISSDTRVFPSSNDFIRSHRHSPLRGLVALWLLSAHRATPAQGRGTLVAVSAQMDST